MRLEGTKQVREKLKEISECLRVLEPFVSGKSKWLGD